MKKEHIIMTGPVRIAFYLNVLLIITGFIFGIRYIFSTKLLPYQIAALGITDWANVVPEYKTMLVTFVRVAGLGMTSVSVGLSLILFNGFLKGQNWSRWAFIGLFSAHYLPLMANMAYLKTITSSTPPSIPNIIAIAIAFISFFLSSGLSKCESSNN